ncbi:MAG TPA: hypothetical protein PKC88_14925, partial [Plasticicumulans sp.]|nr:hypothetical protein [Plasticicumulans sp.]
MLRYVALTLELRTALHVGAGRAGMIARARPFVPGHVLAYALTNVLGAARGGQKADFAGALEDVLAGLRCGPLFVVDPQTGRGLLPAREREAVEALCFTARNQVALHGDSRSAVDGALYEIEAIDARCHAPSGRPQPTRLRGGLWTQVEQIDGRPLRDWLGQVRLTLDDRGGAVELDLRVDEDAAVELPGGPGAWPQGVREGGRPVVVTDRGGRPVAWLDAGDHHLTWTLAWASRPNGLPLPTGTALVDLTLDGQPVIFPLVDAAGLLRLGARDSDGPGENRLTLEVSRRVDDGVPLRVSTHIELRASGTAREVALGQVIVPGTLPYAVTADLPARLMPDGALTVQLRPGTFHVDVDAVAPG